ncbi:hypothetical protein WJX73_005432 [Symbiochloris irregularis]|uniref:Uncharacterized protein n=1 Tax=Symbiochloris irregularis TaxID=706552 RepID=A0AAW1PIU3_9CHLO
MASVQAPASPIKTAAGAQQAASAYVPEALPSRKRQKKSVPSKADSAAPDSAAAEAVQQKERKKRERLVMPVPPKPMTEKEIAAAEHHKQLAPAGLPVKHVKGREVYRKFKDEGLDVEWRLGDHDKDAIKRCDKMSREFYTHVRKAKVTEKVRVDAIKADRAAKAKEAKPAEDGEQGEKKREKQPSARPDMVGYTNFMDERAVDGKRPERPKALGHVPGIQITRRFFLRTEMMALGCHGQLQGGIDTAPLPKSVAKETGCSNVCCAIINSGGYKDDTDEGSRILYTGSGANDGLGNKEQIENQKLTRGNLALVANVYFGIPVRVFRKFDEPAGGEYDSHYVYDGLYHVEAWHEVTGKKGFIIYQYTLVRVKDQGELLSKQVAFCRSTMGLNAAKRTQMRADTAKVVCKDVSRGCEKLPIMCVNDVDDEPYPAVTIPGEPAKPGCMQYTTGYQLGRGVKAPADRVPNKAVKPHTYVAQLNNGSLPYFEVSAKGKMQVKLGRVRHLVHECGPWTGCPLGINCPQAISQQGLSFRLEMFRTPGGERGWGLRTMETIPEFRFVMRYSGVVQHREATEGSESHYLFDIGKRSDLDCNDREFPDGDPDHETKYTVDADQMGNVTRYINHSCQPNLFIQPVQAAGSDPFLVTLCFFASRNIGAYEELTFDYGSGFLETMDHCSCGSAVCSKP